MCKELHVIQVNIHPNLGEVNRKLSKNEEQILHTLNTNFGGLARGGNQSSSLRRYTRQVMHIFESLLELKVAFMPKISFSQRDVDQILPHEDGPWSLACKYLTEISKEFSLTQRVQPILSTGKRLKGCRLILNSFGILKGHWWDFQA